MAIFLMPETLDAWATAAWLVICNGGYGRDDCLLYRDMGNCGSIHGDRYCCYYFGSRLEGLSE